MPEKTAITPRPQSLVESVAFDIPSTSLPEGCQFRKVNQMPVLAGLGCSVRDVVGSVRKLRIAGSKLVGWLRWCDDEKSKALRGKYKAGLLTLRMETVDLAICSLRHGEEFRGHHGPMNLVYEWQPLQVRLVARYEQ